MEILQAVRMCNPPDWLVGGGVIRMQIILPNVPWEEKNQAAVHFWYERVFGFPVEPLVSSTDAIGTWPEPATCVAVKLLDNDELVIVALYGLDDLFHS